jgi:phosphatidylglycerophosphate synthase
METLPDNRRPLKSRNTNWAAATARALARMGFKPNQISIFSVVFAAASGGCFVFSAHAEGLAKIAFLLIAAVCIQCRLLCNLFDGMVAVEGGMRTKSGEIYNELPDRVADAFILLGAGYGSHGFKYSAELGWAAALLAVMTAYVRALGVVAGAPQQFCGPMAKPHRMATMTVAAVLSAGEVLLQWPSRAIPAALGLIVLGCFVTMIRRTYRIVGELNSK